METKYIPQIGDSVVAERIIKSKLLYDKVIGPVVHTWDDACQIVTNEGTEVEGRFRLKYDDWKFDFLHKTSEE